MAGAMTAGRTAAAERAAGRAARSNDLENIVGCEEMVCVVLVSCDSADDKPRHTSRLPGDGRSMLLPVSANVPIFIPSFLMPAFCCQLLLPTYIANCGATSMR